MADSSDDRNRDPNAAGAVNGNGGRRKKLIAGVLALFAVAGIAYGVYWATVARYIEYTDNAYVAGNVVQITPQVTGTVVSIAADDTQFVQAGQVLVELDKADAEVALQEAESGLAKTVREVRNLFATSEQEQANVEERQADLAKARQDLARRERLADSGAISQEEVQHARDAVKGAEAALAAARQRFASSRAFVDRTTVEQHPDVLRAAAAVKDAYLGYARTALPAPVSGFVARRNAQLGQRVSPGMPLMAVVPLDEVWVDANFKEPQLYDIRIGQPATLTADVYGGKVRYHGRVVGFGAGTGAAFALLPAQNATGNWIKIVQRVPVRVALDPQEVVAHPLRIGLSMQVKVDVHDRDGQQLPPLTRNAPAYQTEVFDSLDRKADERVRAIIAANEGYPSPGRSDRGSEPGATGSANGRNRAHPPASARAGDAIGKSAVGL